MNFVFVPLSSEQVGSRIIIEGERYLRLQREKDLKKDDSLWVVLEGRGRAHCVVTMVNASSIECEIREEQPFPDRIPCTFIVAVPRPQTIKKVLHIAASFGVAEVEFVRSAHTEKSYLQSRTLRESEIRDEIEKSLEQVGDGVFPRVRIHRSFSELCRECSLNDGNTGLFADTDPKSVLTVNHLLPQGFRGHYRLAIGPELGWSQDERNMFFSYGFQSFSLGSRIFRVEHALLTSLSQIECLRIK